MVAKTAGVLFHLRLRHIQWQAVCALCCAGRALLRYVSVSFIQMHNISNCDFWWDEEAEVCVVNDNAGRKFQFLKIAGSETWVTQEAIDHANDQMTQRNSRSFPNPVFDQSVQPDVRALGSIKRTDILVLGIHTVRPELDLSPLRVEGRAALYSFGF